MGTSPGRQPAPGEEFEQVKSGRTEPWLTSGQEASTSPAVLPERTSPGRRYPEPGFKDFPKFSYPESYRDHVYRHLSKNAKELLFVVTVRKCDLVGIRRFGFL